MPEKFEDPCVLHMQLPPGMLACSLLTIGINDFSRYAMSETDPEFAAAPTRELVIHKIGEIFPDPERQRVLVLLDEYVGEAPDRRARVQLAILKLSEARIDRLPELLEIAKRDSRDVVAPAEYPKQHALGFTGTWSLSESERQAAEYEDRKQYLAWLKS